MLKFPLSRFLRRKDKAVIFDWRVLVLPLARSHLKKEVTARSQGWAYRHHPRLHMAILTLVTKRRRAKAEELGVAWRGQTRKSGGRVAGVEGQDGLKGGWKQWEEHGWLAPLAGEIENKRYTDIFWSWKACSWSYFQLWGFKEWPWLSWVDVDYRLKYMLFLNTLKPWHSILIFALFYIYLFHKWNL